MKPSLLIKVRHEAIEAGMTLGRWIEEAVEEKLARGIKEKDRK